MPNMTVYIFYSNYNKKQMFPVIDFRNGRYQGQTKNQLPHGYGCFMDRNFVFCIGEWIAGELQGNAIIIFPSGSVFYGRLNYGKMQGICFFQMFEDKVKLITYNQSQNRQRETSKIAAILPLLNVVLDIDNSSPSSAHVLKQYEYSTKKQGDNIQTVSKILNLDRNDVRNLENWQNFISYFQSTFYSIAPSIFQFLINGAKQKKQYFLGLKGQGLGVKIYLNEQVTLHGKVGRVYIIRAIGYFTKENQLKDIGFKMIDNSMKEIVYQEGIYSLPKSIIKYQKGKRPINCAINVHSYLKRSLFYRDKILSSQYIYELQTFILSFNKNLRKIETERLAQSTIQNPNNEIQNIQKIQDRRQNKRPLDLQYEARQTVYKPSAQNPYMPIASKVYNPEYNLNVAKNDIYRSASRKKYVQPEVYVDYKNIEYVDPKFVKIDKDYDFIPIRDTQSPTKYRNSRQNSPSRYRIPQDYPNDYVPLRDRPQRMSPIRDKSYDYPQRNYPDSLYPQRRQSPTRRYPSDYNQDNRYQYTNYNRRY